ncbi:MAG: hypothetical protein ABI602_02125 [Candidatus Saccharibacteria bacterium]
MNYITEQEIEITSVAFHPRPNNERLRGYPRRMVYDGTEYTFIELSMQYLVRKGQQLIQLFDMFDGTTLYRLRCENNRWTIIGTGIKA